MTRRSRILTCAMMLGLTGCATLRIHDASPMQAPATFPPHEPVPLTVGIEEVIPRGTPSQVQHGGLTKLFAEQLTQARVFARVLFPLRPEDQPDALLKVSYWMDDLSWSTSYYRHFWANYGRSLLLVVPFIVDLSTEAQLDVDVQGQRLQRYRALSHLVLDVYWRDLFFQRQLNRTWQEALDRSATDVQRLLIARVLEDQAFFAALPHRGTSHVGSAIPEHPVAAATAQPPP